MGVFTLGSLFGFYDWLNIRPSNWQTDKQTGLDTISATSHHYQEFYSERGWVVGSGFFPHNHPRWWYRKQISSNKYSIRFHSIHITINIFLGIYSQHIYAYECYWNVVLFTPVQEWGIPTIVWPGIGYDFMVARFFFVLFAF